MVDGSTKLYILKTEFALDQRESGSGSTVLTTANWARDLKKLKNARAQISLAALMLRLADLKLDKPISQGWMKFPLGFADGVGELRTEGVRSYGTVIGNLAERTLVLFEAVENKKFKKANTDLIERAAEIGGKVSRRWKELSQLPDPPSPSGVVELDQRRQSGKVRR